MNALDMLRDDHAALRRLLADIDRTPPRGVMTRARLFTQLRERFGHHEVVQEQLLYPVLEHRDRLPVPMADGRRVHAELDGLMADLAAVTFDDREWDARYAALRPRLERHLDEEEANLFDRIRDALSQRELDQLGRRMGLQRESSRSVTPPA